MVKKLFNNYKNSPINRSMISNEILYGLVLTGGKSSRMGIDKSMIEYHGLPQRDYLIELLKEVCDDVFLSVHTNGDDVTHKDTKYIVDKNLYLGSFNGLYIAYLEHPDVSWLVVACDLPFMDLDALRHLRNNRNKQKSVTAYCKKGSQFPEPLCAIWESNSFQKAEAFFTKGEGASPSKFLQTIDIECVYPKGDQILMNANTLEEYQTAKMIIDSKII
jgi:molybdenum cofactor guanylyltransferase